MLAKCDAVFNEFSETINSLDILTVFKNRETQREEQ